MLRDTYDAFLTRNDAAEDVHNALGSVAVPEGRDAPGLAFTGEGFAGGGNDFGGIGAHEQVGALCDGYGALSVLAECKARHAEGRGFLLDTAGISENEGGAAEQAKKVQIADRLDELEIGVVRDAGLSEALAGARMDRKDDGDLRGDGIDGTEEFIEFGCGVNVRRPVQSEDSEAAPIAGLSEAKFVPDRGLLGDRKEVTERIDHDVADEEDGIARAAFLEEMFDGIFLGDEEVVGESVRQDAIDLFRHGTVEAAKASFDMGDAHAQLDGGKGDGNGGVDVAHDENQIGLVVKKGGFDTLEDFGGLGGVGAGADLEIDVGCWNAHLAEENVVELVVVVLAGMNEERLDIRVALHFAHQRRNFGKVGARPNDVHDFETARHFPRLKVEREGSIAFASWRFGARGAPFARKKHWFAERRFEKRAEAT